MSKNTIIALVGPTASGKSAAAVKIAKAFNTEVLSFDSRQFYEEMSIGTAKTTQEEMDGVPHHFIGHISIREHYSAGDFEIEAMEFLDDFFDRKNVIVAVGGSGMYLDALQYGLDEFPEVSIETKSEVQEIADQGIEALQRKLQELDPDYYEKVDRQNPARLMRAIEVSLSAGRPYSDFLNQDKAERNFEVIRIGMDLEREELYSRINSRVDHMMEAGLLKEAETLYPMRLYKALDTVGYSELFKVFDGEWELDFAVDKIKQHSRNYAKRQMTWFRKDSTIEWLSPIDSDSHLSYLSTRID